MICAAPFNELWIIHHKGDIYIYDISLDSRVYTLSTDIKVIQIC